MTKIAILGYGVVGSGVYEVIRTNAESISRRCGKDIDIKYIMDIRDFDDHPEKNLFTKDFEKILNDSEVDIIAEVIGGIKPAYDFTKRALLAEKSVVTSNKELVATHGSELLQIAADKGVCYLFEASVGGGIPIIRPLRQCLAANEITEIMGILNGTTNYILTQMVKEGRDFKTALADAQAKGYAESDPTADIEGHDACRKIAILSSLAYGKQVDVNKIATEGISKLSLTDVSYAEKLGYVIKLIGYSRRTDDGGVIVFVSPMLIPKEHPLAGVDDVFNAIMVKGNAIGDAMFYGRGAGKLPTASAVVADIIDIAANGQKHPLLWSAAEEDYIKDVRKNAESWFVRAPSEDKDAVLKSFPDISMTAEGGEIAFITPKMPAYKLEEKLAGVNCISRIRAAE